MPDNNTTNAGNPPAPEKTGAPEGERLICCQCEVPLEPREATFSYLGHDFSATLPSCPRCGQIYLPEDLVNGRVAEVEQALEDK